MEVRIHNEIYTIYFVDERNIKLISPEDGRIHWGITRYDEKEIYVRNDLDEDTVKRILIHELIHAFIDCYGFAQVNWKEEVVADFLEKYFQEIQDILYQYEIHRKENKK